MSARTIDGIEIAFETVWAAVALVAGLLVANAVAPAHLAGDIPRTDDRAC